MLIVNPFQLLTSQLTPVVTMVTCMALMWTLWCQGWGQDLEWSLLTADTGLRDQGGWTH